MDVVSRFLGLCSLNETLWLVVAFSIVITRNRAPSVHIGYGICFYFSGLSLRKTSQILSSYFTKRNHVSILNWIQKHKPKRLSSKKKNFRYKFWTFSKVFAKKLCLLNVSLTLVQQVTSIL